MKTQFWKWVNVAIIPILVYLILLWCERYLNGFILSCISVIYLVYIACFLTLIFIAKWKITKIQKTNVESFLNKKVGSLISIFLYYFIIVLLFANGYQYIYKENPKRHFSANIDVVSQLKFQQKNNEILKIENDKSKFNEMVQNWDIENRKLAEIAYDSQIERTYKIITKKFKDSQESFLSFQEFVYFSLVTISTTGYGDIVPTSALSRGIVTFEITLGLVLLVFLITSIGFIKNDEITYKLQEINIVLRSTTLIFLIAFIIFLNVFTYDEESKAINKIESKTSIKYDSVRIDKEQQKVIIKPYNEITNESYRNQYNILHFNRPIPIRNTLGTEFYEIEPNNNKICRMIIFINNIDTGRVKMNTYLSKKYQLLFNNIKTVLRPKGINLNEYEFSNKHPEDEGCFILE